MKKLPENRISTIIASRRTDENTKTLPHSHVCPPWATPIHQDEGAEEERGGRRDEAERVRDKEECVWDKEECVRDKEECAWDKVECVRDQKECVRDKEECVSDQEECEERGRVREGKLDPPSNREPRGLPVGAFF